MWTVLHRESSVTFAEMADLPLVLTTVVPVPYRLSTKFLPGGPGGPWRGDLREVGCGMRRDIADLMAQAAGVDAAEDSEFGNLSGDEIPEELKRREPRLAKIQEAKAALEEAARQKA